MNPTQVVTHVSDAWSRLLSQFQDKARLKTLIDILLRPTQELENVFWDLYTLRRLSAATGAQLDVIGRIVDEERAGLLDDPYRSLLRIKIMVLRAKGTAPELIKITRALLGNDDFQLTEYYPAAMVINIDAPLPVALATIKRFLVRAKSGGVRLDVTATNSDALRYSSVDSGGGHGAYGSTESGGGNAYGGVV